MTAAESTANQALEASSTPVADLFAIAKVNGEAYTKLPDDLYIPPDALRIFLDTFEGPLDLLLYLIRAQNIDILNIPVARITHQYLEYVNLMQASNFDLAAEYLLMAAWLGEIKSRLLLPRPVNADGEEEVDPRAELIRRLQEYERFKQAAEHIDSLPCEGRDFFIAQAQAPDFQRTLAPPQVDLRELLLALHDVLNRADLSVSHQVSRESLSMRERMSNILELLRGQRFVPFVQLFTVAEGRLGVVVSFMAILELVKEGLIDIVQADAFADLHVRARIGEAQGNDLDLGDEQAESDVERAFDES
ncbi:MAG: ScpA family protein [Paraperlucidibaca sp.]